MSSDDKEGSVYIFKDDAYSSHMKIVSFLRKFKKRLDILDVGCSKGFIGRCLHEYHDFYGVDVNPDDLKLARKFYKKLDTVDLDVGDVPFEEHTFDVVIFGDVLEHLKDPEAVLRLYMQHVREGGYIIISVPNVAHLYVRLKLLFGMFDYQDRGIMDKTHLRFFTRKTIRALVRRVGLSIVKEDVTPIPLPIVHPLFSKGKALHFVHSFSYFLASLFRTLLGFQFVIFGKKKR